MFDSCTGINIYMISVGPVLCRARLAGSSKRQRRGGRAEPDSGAAAGEEMSLDFRWAHCTFSFQGLAWRVELYMFRRLRKRSWIWWFPAVTFCSCSVVCLMLKVFLNSWVKQYKKKSLRSCFRVIIRGWPGVSAARAEVWSCYMRGFQPFLGDPPLRGSSGLRKSLQGSAAQFLWWKHFPFSPPQCSGREGGKEHPTAPLNPVLLCSNTLAPFLCRDCEGEEL